MVTQEAGLSSWTEAAESLGNNSSQYRIGAWLIIKHGDTWFIPCPLKSRRSGNDEIESIRKERLAATTVAVILASLPSTSTAQEISENPLLVASLKTALGLRREAALGGKFRAQGRIVSTLKTAQWLSVDTETADEDSQTWRVMVYIDFGGMIKPTRVCLRKTASIMAVRALQEEQDMSIAFESVGDELQTGLRVLCRTNGNPFQVDREVTLVELLEDPHLKQFVKPG